MNTLVRTPYTTPTVLSTSHDTPHYDIDVAIADWLTAKAGRTGSKKTAYFDEEEQVWRGEYATNIADYRRWVQEAGTDLDSLNGRGLAQLARAWASHSKRGQSEVSANTYNLRLSILSSFFSYAAEGGYIPDGNPILSYCKQSRRKVAAYSGAQPLDDIKERVAAIDTSTLTGKRDKAIILFGLYTGLRASEIINVRWQDARFTGDKVSIRIRRTKGGKTRTLTLPTPAARALTTFLTASYHSNAALATLDNDTPLWPSLSRKNRGEPITTQALGKICKKHLGTSKIHTLRHTFAKLMVDHDAPLTAVQGALGHDNIATTGRYVRALSSEENEWAERFDVE